MNRLTSPAAALALLTLAAGCGGHAAPGPSQVTSHYAGKVDDAVRETASVVLVTTAPIVISEHCAEVTADAGAVDRLVARGLAARLPANVTIYTTPYDPVTLDSLPEVVTDDGYAGKLCTPHSFSIPTPSPGS